MADLPIEIVDERVVALVGERRYLVSTGIAKSFGDEEAVTLAGRRYALEPHFLGMHAGEVRAMAGGALDGVLGIDVLGTRAFSIAYEEGRLGVAEPPPARVGRAIDVELLMGVPSIELELEGQTLRAFVDTGLRLSYVDERYVGRWSASGSASDFYPGLGGFRSAVYEREASLSGIELPLRIGCLPAVLHDALAATGVTSVVGIDLLRSFDVHIDPGNTSGESTLFVYPR